MWLSCRHKDSEASKQVSCASFDKSFFIKIAMATGLTAQVDMLARSWDTWRKLLNIGLVYPASLYPICVICFARMTRGRLTGQSNIGPLIFIQVVCNQSVGAINLNGQSARKMPTNIHHAKITSFCLPPNLAITLNVDHETLILKVTKGTPTSHHNNYYSENWLVGGYYQIVLCI